jgi:hypothetical protein
MSIKSLFLMIAGVAIATQTLFAQSNIRGKVTDADDKSPVFATNMVLLRPDSSFVLGASSNLEGVFELRNVPHGDYILSTSFVGYETAYIPFHSQENKSKYCKQH